MKKILAISTILILLASLSTATINIKSSDAVNLFTSLNTRNNTITNVVEGFDLTGAAVSNAMNIEGPQGNPFITLVGGTTSYISIKQPLEVKNQLDMNSNPITNLQSPNSPKDAVTKDYVDAASSSSSYYTKAYLTSSEYAGDHNCDDNPSNCNIPSGWHMCYTWELKDVSKDKRVFIPPQSPPSGASWSENLGEAGGWADNGYEGWASCYDYTSSNSGDEGSSLTLDQNNLIRGTPTCDLTRRVWVCKDK